MPGVSAVYSGVTGGAIEAIGVPVPAEARTVDPADRLGALFEVHHERLYRLARRLSRNADAARDLVQETFLRAARSPESVPTGATSEEAWLVRVLINVCRDGWRKKAVRTRFDAAHAVDSRARGSSDQEAALIARATVWHALGC